MTDPVALSAVLLAAGLSRRCGTRDKLLVQIDGEPLVARTAARLCRIGEARRVLVVGQREQLLVGNPQPVRDL